MPNIRSVSDIENAISESIAWRIKEISTLKSFIPKNQSPTQTVLIRAGIPLLYAHWEGFVKNCAEWYVEYVSRKRIKYEELQSGFVIMALKKELNELQDMKRFNKNVHLVDFFAQQMQKRASIPRGPNINTESNLNYDVLSSIIASIGLDGKVFELHENFIDVSLLSQRNKIAHGEYLSLTYSAYENISDEVVSLMRNFQSLIINAVANDSFKR